MYKPTLEAYGNGKKTGWWMPTEYKSTGNDIRAENRNIYNSRSWGQRRFTFQYNRHGNCRWNDGVVFSLCGHPPPFYPHIIHFWWAAPLPWKWSKHPKCDAPVTTKYLIIATSFSGRRCLHLCVSLSVYDLEMKDWQRGHLHSCVGEGDQVASR